MAKKCSSTTQPVFDTPLNYWRSHLNYLLAIVMQFRLFFCVLIIRFYSVCWWGRGGGQVHYRLLEEVGDLFYVLFFCNCIGCFSCSQKKI